jgi:hypothetical protein
MNGSQLKEQLLQFTGTEQWYRHSITPKLLYTDGVRFVATNAGHGAYWLLDKIGTEILPLQIKEPFIVVRLNVTGSKAKLSADDGNDNVIYTEDILYTDFPEGEWKFYLIDNILLLTSEY